MTAHYQPWLVALSLIVAIAVSYTALTLAGRVASTHQSTSRLWLLLGSVAMGMGIWSIHFIGMLAYSVPVTLRYDVATTLLSLGAAILTSGLALTVASRPALTQPRLIASAVFMGAGIFAMHYIGMDAITVHPAIHYRLDLLAASALIAISASYIALWLVFQLRRGNSWSMQLARLLAAIVMGTAITGMHYTGMAATVLMPGAYCLGGLALDPSWVAVTVGLMALGVLSVAMVTALYDGHLELRVRQERRRLYHLSTHDPLTGIANRESLEAQLGELLNNSATSRRPFAVLMLDLDRFRQINDSLGQRVGDNVLREVAQRLSSIARGTDVVARINGDQFVLLLHPPTDWRDAEHVGQRINTALAEPIRSISTGLRLSSSIGISMFPLHADTTDGLIARAETAMQYAKEGGRNAVRCFTPEMEFAMRERLQLETDLRVGLAESQFELYYQPKIDGASGRVPSAEALLRWHHPTRGMVPPDIFIPVAEACGLIQDIGDWVLHEACRQNRAWRDAGLPPLTLAVNVSAAQFHGERLFNTVSAALASNGLEPQWLELELTESVVMSDPAQSIDMLERLSRMGVLLAIDDFGTGYSSMSYLRRFPLDKLKIDRSFIKDMARGTDDVTIVQAIISLAHSLRLKVVAEGVENAEQLKLLQELGCDKFQGYHFSRALPAAEFAAFIRGWHAPGRRHLTLVR